MERRKQEQIKLEEDRMLAVAAQLAAVKSRVGESEAAFGSKMQVRRQEQDSLDKLTAERLVLVQQSIDDKLAVKVDEEGKLSTVTNTLLGVVGVRR